MGDETIEVELYLPILGRGAPVQNAVVRVQHMLNDRGYGPLVEDGDFGPKTEEAVKKLQEAYGIDQGGHVGPQTWPALLTDWLTNSEGC